MVLSRLMLTKMSMMTMVGCWGLWYRCCCLQRGRCHSAWSESLYPVGDLAAGAVARLFPLANDACLERPLCIDLRSREVWPVIATTPLMMVLSLSCRSGFWRSLSLQRQHPSQRPPLDRHRNRDSPNLRFSFPPMTRLIQSLQSGRS